MSDNVITNECRVCKHELPRPLYTVNQCELETCINCGFVQVKDVPDDEFLNGLYREAYFDRGKYVDDLAARHEFRRRLKMLEKQGLFKDAKLLDFGCATGEFLHGVYERCDASGLDVSSEAITKAILKFPELKGRLFTLEALEEVSNSFDFVVMWDVIEHLPNPVELLKQIYDHLRMDGILILSTPNIGAPIAKVMGRYWAFMTPPEHLGYFNKTSMEKALVSSGFEMLEWYSRGKLVNLGFLLYKAYRVFPKLVPRMLWEFFSNSLFKKLCFYVPTKDIQYIVCRKTYR